MRILPIDQVTKDIARNAALYGSWGEIIGDDNYPLDVEIPVKVTICFPDFPKEQIVIGAETCVDVPVASEVTVNVSPTQVQLPSVERLERISDRVTTEDGKTIYIERPKDNRPSNLFTRIVKNDDFPNLTGKTVFVPVVFPRRACGKFQKYNPLSPISL